MDIVIFITLITFIFTLIISIALFVRYVKRHKKMIKAKKARS